MQYVNSYDISTMSGLQIPVYNISDFYTFVETSAMTEITEGCKAIAVSTIYLENFTMKEGYTTAILKSKLISTVNSPNNLINIRIPTNSNTIKWILAYENGGSQLLLSDVNEATTSINTRNYAFLSGDTQRFAELIAIFYYDSPNGKRYYTFKPSYNNNDGLFVGSYKFACWDDFALIEIREKSEEYGSYSDVGGYGGGSFDDSSDAFGLPSLPSLGVSEAGFVNVYKPTAGQLVGFADELFPDFEMPTPSQKTGIDGVVENLNNVSSVLGFFADSYLNKGLIDYVIDCHIVPVAPSITSNTGIKVGYKTFNYNPSKVTSDYVEFDCGSLQIAEYYQNFLDYEGTRAKLYAPFIGFVDIKPEWFQSGSLRLVYHFNIIDGSCIAFVIATSSKSKLSNTVVATFGGNCCVHMPITGLNYSSMISGVLGGASKVLSGQIANGAEQVATARPSIEQSNGYNAGMSFMCYRRPYLLIERPVASFSKNYPREQGLPLNVTKKLGSLKGFTTCTAPIVDNFHCLDEEKALIKQALIEGTIF